MCSSPAILYYVKLISDVVFDGSWLLYCSAAALHRWDWIDNTAIWRSIEARDRCIRRFASDSSVEGTGFELSVPDAGSVAAMLGDDDHLPQSGSGSATLSGFFL